MSYYRCRRITLFLMLMPGALLVTGQAVETFWTPVSTYESDIPISTETTYVPTSTETTYVPISTETMHVPTKTETLTTTLTTRLPLPVAGFNALTASILSTTSDTTIFAASDCLTPASTCVFVKPVTFTAAPNTYLFTGSGYWNILGQFDCSISRSPRTAACTWTIGSYPSSALANLTNHWITDPARSSVTAFAALTDHAAGDDSQTAAQVFVDVVYTKVYYVTRIKDVYVTQTTESYVTLTTESYVTWTTASEYTSSSAAYETLWYGDAGKCVGVAHASWALVAAMVVLSLALDMLV